jgi:hypothetical protein
MMAMEDPRSLVLEWLQAGADYDQGVLLFARVGKNRNMAVLFPGRKYRFQSKLRYELCKSVGLDWKKLPLGTKIEHGPGVIQTAPFCDSDSSFSSASVSVSIYPSPYPSIVASASPNHGCPVINDSDQYPSVVRRVIHEYGEAYRERSRLHYQMSTGPGDNAPESMAVRRDLLARIKALSLRMDELFSAKENYLRSKVLPDAAALWPPERDDVSSSSSSISSLEDQPLPDDPAELRRLKKNLQTYNVKDNNLLLYQSATVQPQKLPMPAGPRRLGIEKRIRARLKQIERIDYKLVEHAG